VSGFRNEQVSGVRGAAVTMKNSIIIFGVFVVELWPNAKNSKLQALPDLKIGPNKSQIPIFNEQNTGMKN